MSENEVKVDENSREASQENVEPESMKDTPKPRNLLELMGVEMYDTVTGFTGTVVGVHFYITGNPVLSLQPKTQQHSTFILPEQKCFEIVRLAETVKSEPTKE